MHMRFLLTLSAFAAASLANVMVRGNDPIKKTLNFDDEKVPSTTLEFIKEYKGVKFNGFNLGNSGGTIIGPVSPSLPLIIATSFRAKLLGGITQNPDSLVKLEPLTTPGNFTVKYPGSPYESMDLHSLVFATPIGSPVPTIGIPLPVEVTFRGYYANGADAGHLTFPFEIVYSGTGLKFNYKEAVFGKEFQGISTLSVEFSSGLVQSILGKAMVVQMDNIDLTLNPQKDGEI